MVTFLRFNIVLVGSFDGQNVDLGDFSFNGQQLTGQIRVPPVLQAKAGEYFIESMPGRFGVGADAAKATEHRLDAIKANAKAFASEYAGRRSITGVGLNFTGHSQVRGGAPALLAKLVDTGRLTGPLAADEDELRVSCTSSWVVADLGRVNIRIEPLDADPSELFFDANIHIGATVAGSATAPAVALPIPVAEAVERMGAARDMVNSIIERVLSPEVRDAD